MTNAYAGRVAETAFGPGAFRPAAGTRSIVFCGIGEDAQLALDLHDYQLDELQPEYVLTD
jgi:hypothetical protein